MRGYVAMHRAWWVLLLTAVASGAYSERELAGMMAAALPEELVANGSFEHGLRGRVSDPSERVAPVDAPGRGGKAASLDGVGSTTEVQLTSLPFQVQPAHEYVLSSPVLQQAGHAGYKVTVGWRRVDGSHIRFGNDWAGDDRPAALAEHAARLTSPPDAALAVIILGVRPGVRCLFDDVALKGWRRARMRRGLEPLPAAPFRGRGS